MFDWPKEVRLEMIVGESGKEPHKAKETKKARQGSSESDRDSGSSGNLKVEGAAREARRKAASELKKEEVSWSILVDQQVED